MNFRWTAYELKETALIVSAVLWGAVLLLPGNTFATTSAIGFVFQYAPDHFWGALLIIACLPILFVNRYSHRFSRYRSFVHALLWIFWSGIFFLIVYRSSMGPNGFQWTSLLISLPFLTQAVLHAIIYADLGKPLK